MKNPTSLTQIQWGNPFVDSTFAGLATPGLVPKGVIQAGMLVSNSGKVISQVTFTVAGVDGALFQANRLRAGFAVDVDGTNYSSPQLHQCNGSGLVASVDGKIEVPSLSAAGFRFVFANYFDADVVVVVNVVQG